MAQNRTVKSAIILGYAFCTLLLAVICNPACKSYSDAKSFFPPPSPVYFSKNWKAEIKFPYFVEEDRICLIWRGPSGGLVAFLLTNDGFLQSTSNDNGKTWAAPSLIFSHGGTAYPIILGGQLAGVFTLERVANGGQIYFHAKNKEGWNAPGPIRDTDWGGFQLPVFAMDSLGNLYCAWTDWRAGNSDVYFSSSFDGGKTWTANVRIDDDQSGQEQNECRLLATSAGTLYAFWTDNRDPETLFDIYCSSSHDGGKSWSPSAKVNDDTTHTFQISPSAVADRQGALYAVWSDYRDKGKSGDILPTIYFARSVNGGKSWSTNLRLSAAAHEHNVYPVFALAENGELHCIWRSTVDYNRADVLHSYSRDGGNLWSAPVQVNDNLERMPQRWIGGLGPDAEGGLVVSWLDWREGQEAIYMAKMLHHPDSTRPERKPQRLALTNALNPALLIKAGETLFQDDFTARPASQWEAESGTWICKDQAYIGYGADEARSFAGSEAWQDYIFSGRFKLDPLDHRAAFLYLRASLDSEGRRRFYRLKNFFRSGAALEYFDGRSFLPLAEAPYPFQKDRWYTFRTVVQGNIVNHFIGDSLLIAADKLTHLSAGKIGVGAFFAPTYFRDIVVTAIETPD